MKGWKTIIAGAAMVVIPPLLTYAAGIDWTAIVGPNLAMVIAGGVTIGLRLVTTTPVGTK